MRPTEKLPAGFLVPGCSGANCNCNGFQEAISEQAFQREVPFTGIVTEGENS